MEKSVYPNPAAVAATKFAVCFVAHGGAKSWDTTHGMKEIKQGAEKVKVCKIYPNIVCTDHVDAFKERAAAVFGDKVFATPHYIYYTPAGEELFRNFGVVTPQQFQKDHENALAKVEGTHVSKEEYDAAMGTIREAKALVKKDEIKKAIALFQKISKGKNVRLQPVGENELNGLEASGDARVEAAVQTLGTSEEQGKKELKKVADEYPPLPCSKKAAEVLRLMAEKGR